MRYFEMFAGVGGFGIGIQRAYENKHRHTTPTQEQEPDTGVRGGDVHADEQLLEGTPTCVGFSEIDPHASNVLRYHYPDVKNYGDCKTINWSEVPDFDLLVGGSPCMTKKHNWDSYPIEGRIRRLMPVECERLMSWPDGHTAKGRKEDGTEYEVSDTQRYKMCGNGVVSEVVAAIVRELY